MQPTDYASNRIVRLSNSARWKVNLRIAIKIDDVCQVKEEVTS